MHAAALLARLCALPFRTRVAATIAVAFVIVLAAVFASITHDNRVPLFATALHPDQLLEVQERLAEWNIPFSPSADNVGVDGKRRSELLLRLSLGGVPHAHLDTSNEMLSKVSALTPQSIIDEQTRSGLAADLQLALRGIEGVQDASIIIAPGKPAMFADEQSHEGSASVRLRVHPGVHLPPSAIAGIRSFVAAGVPGLDSKHVTILDDRGIALSDDGAGANDSGELQSSLQTALDSAFGTGSTIVRVHVDFEQRAQLIKEIRRSAASSVPISSDHSDEQYTGSNRHYTKSTHSDDRGSDVREVQTTFAPGRLSRVSIAIVVDAAHAVDIYKIRALAEAAAGLDARRGDIISVQAVAFHAHLEPKIDGWFLPAYGLLLSILPAIVIGIVVLAALKLCIQPAMACLNALVTRATILRTRKAVAGFAPTQVRGALRNEPPHTAAAIISALPAATAAAVLDLYPPEERSAIIGRMSRPPNAFMPDFETVIANA